MARKWSIPRRPRSTLISRPKFRNSITGAGLALLAAACTEPDNKDPGPTSLFNPVFSASSDAIRNFLAQGQGGPKAKLIYVDRTRATAKLSFVDFSEPGQNPVIHVIAAATNPSVPVISPDGGWAVYGSGDGCEAGSTLQQRCSVYLVALSEVATPLLLAKDSACEPRFQQNRSGGLV